MFSSDPVKNKIMYERCWDLCSDARRVIRDGNADAAPLEQTYQKCSRLVYLAAADIAERGYGAVLVSHFANKAVHEVASTIESYAEGASNRGNLKPITCALYKALRQTFSSVKCELGKWRVVATVHPRTLQGARVEFAPA